MLDGAIRHVITNGRVYAPSAPLQGVHASGSLAIESSIVSVLYVKMSTESNASSGSSKIGLMDSIQVICTGNAHLVYAGQASTNSNGHYCIINERTAEGR